MQNITFDQYKKMTTLGWSVIPWVIKDVDGKPKKFCPIKWKQFQDRVATDDELKEWDGKYNAFALVTGKLSGVVVVDIDEEVDPEKYPYLSSSVVVKSAFSGGKHYYYSYDTRLSKFGPSAKIEGEPMDYRGEGGVVILPGSFLGDRSYEFEEFNPFGLESLPSEVYNLLKNPKRLTEKGKVVMFDDVFEGNRNDIATRIAGKILRGVEQDLWEVSGWDPLRIWNTDHCHPPLPEHELRTIFESVRNAERRNRLVQIDFGEDQEPQTFTEELEKQISEASTDKFLSGYGKFDEITDGFRYANTYLVAGLEKSGKSSWLMKMLQQKMEQGVKLGYVNTELPKIEFVRRMTAYKLDKPKDEVTYEQMREWSREYEGKFCYLGVEEMPDQEGMIKKVEEFLSKDIKCLIFDNITSWGNKRDAKSEGWQVMADLMDNLIQLTKRAGIITFMVIHLKPNIVENASRQSMNQMLKKGDFDSIFKDQALIIRRPSLSDVYGGGAALSQISGAIFIWRPYQKFEQNELTEKSAIIAESFRHAPNGMISANFIGEKGVFEERDGFGSDLDIIKDQPWDFHNAS